ncbi:hypothetical protein ACFL2X_06375 [Candidatus Latescibacterota bacterium]
MTQNIDLKELERSAYLSFHQDGVPDIILGLWLIFFGIEMSTDLFFINLFLPLIFMGTGYYAKKLITIPRMGYVNFSQRRKTKEKGKMILMVSLGIAVLGVFLTVFLVSGVSSGLMDFLKLYPLLVLAILWAVMPIMSALLLGIKRMYAYAVLIVLFFVPVQAVFPYEPGRVIVTGAVILLAGIWVLARFMKKYPLQEREGLHNEGY